MIEMILIVIILYTGLILWFTAGVELGAQKIPVSSELQKVSIVIAARNEAPRLPALLDALQSQTYVRDLTEIIIVDDRSTDQTSTIVKKWQKKLPGLKLISISEKQDGWSPKKWAIHQAVTAANGEIILLTDADCQPGPDWVKSITAEFSDPAIGVVSGPAPLTDGESFLNQLFELESLAQDAFSAGAMNHGLILSCTGRNLAYRRQVYEDVSGFEGVSHILSGDDDLLLQKIAATTGWQFRFLAAGEAVVPSPPPGSILQFVSQRLRFASKGLQYYDLWTSPALKIILPFLFIVNLLTVISLLMFADSASPFWLVPILVKSAADVWIINRLFGCLDRKWSLMGFLLLMILHPFYIVIFVTLGPFVKIEWKESA